MEKRAITKNFFHHLRNNQRGFTLIEIIIAMTIFAVFIAVYVSTQGSNLADSTLLREEIFLRQLAEEKMAEMIVNPPELRDSLTLSKDTKSFEQYDNYQYTIEWKKFTLPDLSKIKGQSEEEDDNQNDTAKASGIEKNLFNKIKENMEKLIWQVKISVKNKETNFSYSVSTWIINEDHKVKIDGY